MSWQKFKLNTYCDLYQRGEIKEKRPGMAHLKIITSHKIDVVKSFSDRPAGLHFCLGEISLSVCTGRYRSNIYWNQCAQIVRFIGVWETFQSLWQQLICPNLPPTFLGNFVKVSKSIIFLVKSFLGNFYRHLATFYWSQWLDRRLTKPGKRERILWQAIIVLQDSIS